MRVLRGSGLALCALVLSASSAEATRLIVGRVSGSGLSEVRSIHEIDENGLPQLLFELPNDPRYLPVDLAARVDDPGGVYIAARVGAAGFESRVSRIDLASGAIADLYSFTAESLGFPSFAVLELTGIAFSHSDPSSAKITGTVVLGTSFSTVLFDLDLETGATSQIRSVQGILGAQSLQGLAEAPDGSLFVLQVADSRLGSLDPATATFSELSVCGPCDMLATDFDPASGEFFAIGSFPFGGLRRISPETGATLEVVSFNVPEDVWGMAFVVPEPGSGALLASGLLLLARARRDRRMALAARPTGDGVGSPERK